MKVSSSTLRLKKIRSKQDVETLLKLEGWEERTLLNGVRSIPDAEVRRFITHQGKWLDASRDLINKRYFIKVHGAKYYEHRER